MFLAIAVVGCSFESVEDACKDEVGGAKHASAEGAEFFGRITCYRRYAGLGQGRIHKDINAASAAHAAYLGKNGITAVWPYEEFTEPGFTGEDVFERLDEAGFPVDVADTFIWEVLLPVDPEIPRADMVDAYMHEPLARDVFLSPGWEGGGYDEFTEAESRFAYSNIVLNIPSGERSNKPVFYPVDGQVDIPVSVMGLLPYGQFESFGPQSVVGYPISMTFGSSESAALITPNPLGVRVNLSTILGPSGPVEHEVFEPGLYDSGPNNATAFLVPLEPLEPDSDYTVSVDVGWVTDLDQAYEWTFHTGTEAVVSGFAL